jgi:hypothetical protein
VERVEWQQAVLAAGDDKGSEFRDGGLRVGQK